MADTLQRQYALADALVASLSDPPLDLAVLLADLALTGPEGAAIRANVPKASTPRQDCLQLIRTCSRYPQGMVNLEQVLRLHLSERGCWPALQQALSALAQADPAQSQSPGPVAKKVYVSYGWGDATPEGQRSMQLVNQLCEAMKSHGITILRDLEQTKPGDRISRFIHDITQGDLIVVVLSDYYLKSEYCMMELYGIWRRAQNDPDRFLERVIPLTLPDARLRTTGDKLARGEYWIDEKQHLDDRLMAGGIDALGEHLFARYKLIQQFAIYTAEMLQLLTDKCEPTDFDRQAEEGFLEVLEQIQAAMGCDG